MTLEKIKSMVDSNTIIGNPINMADGTLVLPISKVTFGFASGGADFPSKTTKDLFGGGGGAGVSIQPVAFLVVKDGSVRMLQLADTSNSVDRAIGMLPDMVDKITALFNNKQKGAAGAGRSPACGPGGGITRRRGRAVRPDAPCCPACARPAPLFFVAGLHRENDQTGERKGETMRDVRIQKVLAEQGVCSRRAAEQLIREGRVKLNGRPVTVGDKMDTLKDLLTVDGQKVYVPKKSEKYYYMMYKPRGYITTTNDERGRKTVMDLIADVPVRVYPVGRLDKDSEGLLLLTNDGDFCQSAHAPQPWSVQAVPRDGAPPRNRRSRSLR